MTYGKEISSSQYNYRQAGKPRLELPLRLRVFLFCLAVLAISFGVWLAYLLN
jgi:hypothetical protein